MFLPTYTFFTFFCWSLPYQNNLTLSYSIFSHLNLFFPKLFYPKPLKLPYLFLIYLHSSFLPYPFPSPFSSSTCLLPSLNCFLTSPIFFMPTLKHFRTWFFSIQSAMFLPSLTTYPLNFFILTTLSLQMLPDFFLTYPPTPGFPLFPFPVFFNFLSQSFSPYSTLPSFFSFPNCMSSF